MFTQQHYEAIARVIKGRFEEASYIHGDVPRQSREDELRHVAHRLASVFEADNPRFNRVRFLNACTFEPDPELADALNNHGQPEEEQPINPNGVAAKRRRLKESDDDYGYTPESVGDVIADIWPAGSTVAEAIKARQERI